MPISAPGFLFGVLLINLPPDVNYKFSKSSALVWKCYPSGKSKLCRMFLTFAYGESASAAMSFMDDTYSLKTWFPVLMV